MGSATWLATKLEQELNGGNETDHNPIFYPLPSTEALHNNDSWWSSKFFPIIAWKEDDGSTYYNTLDVWKNSFLRDVWKPLNSELKKKQGSSSGNDSRSTKKKYLELLQETKRQLDRYNEPRIASNPEYDTKRNELEEKIKKLKRILAELEENE